MKWNYELRCGRALRRAIEDEDLEKVLLTLRQAYRELLRAGYIDEDDYEEYTSNIDYQLEDTDNLDEDEVDYELSDFYDLCDNLRIWVSM